MGFAPRTVLSKQEGRMNISTGGAIVKEQSGMDSNEISRADVVFELWKRLDAVLSHEPCLGYSPHVAPKFPVVVALVRVSMRLRYASKIGFKKLQSAFVRGFPLR